MEPVFIKRKLADYFEGRVQPGKVLILLGARRVGKTELIKKYIEGWPSDKYLFLNGDDQITIDLFAERSKANYARLVASKELLVIDEAQRIPEIGVKLKLIVDSFPNLRVIATGSSVFDLGNKLGEPLVGRSSVLQLFPFAQLELSAYENYLQTKEKLEERLVFGSYPELESLKTYDEKTEYLDGLVSSYLMRDILEYEGIRKAGKLMDLLRLIALQVGQEVKIDEISSSLKGISRNTVEVYLDLLSKVFVIYRVGGYSGNLRKEVAKTAKWYFYDNGVRNAIIRNFNRLNIRNDVGGLWENYLFSERFKFNSYNNRYANMYFWRTYDHQEIDLVEEKAGEISGFEIKWRQGGRLGAPSAWKKAYPNAVFQVINPDNYLDFIT